VRVPVTGPQRHIAYCDVHVPHNIPVGPVLRFQRRYKPTHIILNGDIINLEWASHWNESVFSEIGWDKIRENLGRECEAARRLIAKIRASSPKAEIYFVPGNHEHWLYYAALYYPKLRIPLPDKTTKLGFRADLAKQGDEALAFILRKILHAEKYGVTVLPYNEPLEIGKITYLHGHQLRGYKNTLSQYPTKNIVFGHFHTEHRETGHDSGESGTAVQHTAVPCMTELGPGYLKNKAKRWLHGFWLADVRADGLFDGRVKKILGGKVMIP
jgi:predicted phosphodiesterase